MRKVNFCQLGGGAEYWETFNVASECKTLSPPNEKAFKFWKSGRLWQRDTTQSTERDTCNDKCIVMSLCANFSCTSSICWCQKQVKNHPHMIQRKDMHATLD